jgi:RNA polymerase sigma-70 factor (ECF subfamily)
MEAFLLDVEKRAYHMASFATGSHADSLDLLQDSMIKLITKYQNKPSDEWKPLFYKILQNKIRDWHRQQKVKNLIFFWKSNTNDEWPTPENEDESIGTPEKKYNQSSTAKCSNYAPKKFIT